jgi:hypothetical protein
LRVSALKEQSRAAVNEERVKVNEERVKVNEERVKVNEERVKSLTERLVHKEMKILELQSRNNLRGLFGKSSACFTQNKDQHVLRAQLNLYQA